MTEQTGPVRAEGKIITLGRRTAFAEGRLTDAAGKLYATATSTLLVFERYARSKIAATPWPPPTHIVSRP
jgi:hypothetical protein